jgi:hypothetical protein
LIRSYATRRNEMGFGDERVEWTRSAICGDAGRARAARGFNLVLAARREEPMQQLAAQLKQRDGQ